MSTTVYSGWSKAWRPSGSSVDKKFRTKWTYSTSSTYTTYTITNTVAVNLNSSVGATFHGAISDMADWDGVESTAKTVFGESTTVTILSNKSHSYTRKTSAYTVELVAEVWSFNGTWDGEETNKYIKFTIPALPSYAINYNPNGGTGAPAAGKKYYGKTATVSVTRPTRSGYSFMGWGTQESPTTVVYNPGDTIPSNINKIINLVAIWHKGAEKPSFTETSHGPYYNRGGGTYSVNISSPTLYDSATVSSITVKFGSQTQTSDSVGIFTYVTTEGGNLDLTVSITDSEGAVTNYILGTVTVITYIPPESFFNVDRTTINGKLADEGTYALVSLPLRWYDGINNNTLTAPTVTVDSISKQITWYKTWNKNASSNNLTNQISDWSTVSNGDTIYGLVNYSISPLNEYTIGVTVADTYGSSNSTVILPQAFFTIDFLAGGHGIAFGQPAEQTGFYCNMDTHLLQGADVTGDVATDGNGYYTGDVYVGCNADSTGGSKLAKESDVASLGTRVTTVEGNISTLESRVLRKGDLVAQTFSKKNVSISANNYVSGQTISVAKSGYTPICIVSYYCSNADSGGQGVSWCNIYLCSLSGTTVTAGVRNYASSTSKIDIHVTVLFKKS